MEDLRKVDIIVATLKGGKEAGEFLVRLSRDFWSTL